MFPPRWRPLGKDKNGVLVIDCPPLKPGKECEGLCSGNCELKHPQDCLFLQTYYKQLKQIDINKFMKSLMRLQEKICKGEELKQIDFALICFEKYDNPCSERVMLQKWLNENGIKCKEWFK